jgi:hypothetical protein
MSLEMSQLIFHVLFYVCLSLGDLFIFVKNYPLLFLFFCYLYFGIQFPCIHLSRFSFYIMIDR